MASAASADSVAAVVARLEARAEPGFRADLVSRYGIHSEPALGVRMPVLRALARELGPDHDLALALWTTGIYEARTVAALVDDPRLVTSAQMDAWAHDFDSWAIVDTACLHLFPRTGRRAWAAVDRWAAHDAEMVRRAAFSLLCGLARHDRDADDEAFLPALHLVERTAGDGRPLVDKAVDMALRAVGRRRPGVADEARAVAERLAASDDPARRRIGRKALRDLA